MCVIWYNNNNIAPKEVHMRKRVREIEFDVDAYTGSMSILWTKKSKDYAAFLSSSSSFCCGVM